MIPSLVKFDISQISMEIHEPTSQQKHSLHLQYFLKLILKEDLTRFYK